jgi:anti-sigma regulatory factor (Ser/Thr protein kinase)
VSGLPRAADGVSVTACDGNVTIMSHAHEHIEFVHRSWPADPEQLVRIRRALAGWLTPLALTEDQIADVVLAVDEAAANAVRHAYGPEESGAVELTLWTEPASEEGPATLSIEVVDHGSWRPPAEVPTEGGRGIGLMSTISESVLIHYDARGSRVLLRHRIPDPG